MNTITQPALFIPHGGGPCFFMEWNPPHEWDELAAFLRGIAPTLPAKPQAVVVISAHWETTPQVEVTMAANPGLLFDYQGFPPHTYALQYPAPGQPELAERIVQRLNAHGIAAKGNPQRKWDHGVFVPLLLMLPEADIPVVQVALPVGDDPAACLALGEALAALRQENILIVASGMSYHNMRGLFGAPGAGEDSAAFHNWLEDTVTATTGEAQKERFAAWATAPAARASHPHAEHLMPLLVAAAAGGYAAATAPYIGTAMGVRLAAFRWE